MVHRKMIILITVVLLLVVFLGTRNNEEYRDNSLPFCFLVNGEKTEVIKPWTDENGNIFIFLPSYADFSSLQLLSTQAVWFDDIQLMDGDSCGSLQQDYPYQLREGGKITFIQSANIPAMYVDTETDSMDKLHSGERGTEETGKLRLYTAEGNINYSGVLRTIKLRGNSTFGQAKKSYSLKFQREANLLHMGSAKKWALLANVYDPTNIRTKMVFDFASKVELPYSPQSQWVDLYLNGEYAGLYLLCEKNEIHPQRVALSNNRGVLVSKDLLYRFIEKNQPYVITDAGVPLRIHDASLDEESIKKRFQSVENAILSECGIDPVTKKHWTDLIDMNSWVRKFLVEEVFGGIDAGRLSQYFYYTEDDTNKKVYAGPVWDFDSVLPHGKEFERVPIIPEMMYASCMQERPWYSALYRNEIFFSQVRKYYKEEFRPVISDTMRNQLNQYASQIYYAAKMNQLRWKSKDFINEVNFLRDGFEKRIDFLDKIWIDGKDYIRVNASFLLDSGYFSVDYYVLPGSCLPNALLGNNSVWYDSEANLPFDTESQIIKDIQIYEKY